MTGRVVKLGDFARECGVTDRAIQKHIKTLADKLDGHYERRGPNGTWLDEVAMDMIRGRMVTPPPPVVSDGRLTEENEKLRRALMELQTKYIAMQEKMIEQAALVAEAEMGKRLLQAAQADRDQKDQELQAERVRAEQAVMEAKEAQEKAAEARAQAEAAAAALEAEKSRRLTLKERLTGRREA